MDTIVISLGGSVLLSKDIDKSYYESLKKTLQSHNDKKIYVVVGGGPPAREYISRARALQFSELMLDNLGIEITRVNALFLLSYLQNDVSYIPHSTKEAADFEDALVIMGGTTPGHSTDFVGAELASLTKASLFVIATNVDGVYDKDPRKHADAEMYDSISAHDLLETYGSSWNAAGSNTVIDGPALKKIVTDKIPTVVINGKNINTLDDVLSNRSFHGTELII